MTEETEEPGFKSHKPQVWVKVLNCPDARLILDCFSTAASHTYIDLFAQLTAICNRLHLKQIC